MSRSGVSAACRAVTHVTFNCATGHIRPTSFPLNKWQGLRFMKKSQTPSVGRFRFVPHGKREIMTPTPMREPYGLEIIESCITCPHREDRLFCNLSPAAVQRLSTITSASSYPKGATLFVEG